MGTYKNVIVLGRGRCGTSMVSGILDRLGIDMKTGVRDEKRTRGYYEGGKFISWLRSVAKENEPFAKDSPPKKSINSFEKFRKWGHWGNKTKASLTLLPWLKKLSNVYVIVLSRDRDAQSESISKNFWSDKKEKEFIYKTIVRFHDKVERFFRNNPDVPRLDLDFDYIIDNPVEATRIIAEFVEMPYKKEASDFIDRNMRNYGKK